MSTSPTVREAREQYFEASGFGAETYTETWVKLPFGRFNLYFPNLPSRRRAVKLHDIDHVLTGYGTTWSGEARISAFELGAGMYGHLMGLLLNLTVFAIGAVRLPEVSWQAFLRGRQSGSIFQHGSLTPELLDGQLEDLRAALPVAPVKQRVGTTRDRVAYAGLYALSLSVYLGPVAVLAACALLWG